MIGINELHAPLAMQTFAAVLHQPLLRVSLRNLYGHLTKNVYMTAEGFVMDTHESHERSRRSPVIGLFKYVYMPDEGGAITGGTSNIRQEGDEWVLDAYILRIVKGKKSDRSLTIRCSLVDSKIARIRLQIYPTDGIILID